MSRARPRIDAWLLALTPLMAVLLLFPRGGGWGFIALAPLTLYAGFLERIRGGDFFGAMSRGVAWALLLSAGAIVATLWVPEAATASVVHGEVYRDEMFRWIRTGIGREGSWRQFLPEHALHLTVFALLTVTTRGYLGLALGAALLAYMNYFVASFVLASGTGPMGIAMTWFPWAVARVLAFIALGTLLSVRPRETLATTNGRRLLTLAVAGIAIDIALKWLLAPAWGAWLRPLLTSVAR